MAKSRKTQVVTEESRKQAPARKRVPVSGNRDILTVAGMEKGYKYRWVNEKDNRLQKFVDAGYEFVHHDGQIGQDRVDDAESIGPTSKNVGRGVTSYLMRIQEDWYKEDQVAKQADIDAKESSLHSRGDGQYGELKIK